MHIPTGGIQAGTRFFIMVVTVCLSSSAWAQTLTTVVDNGPSSNRVDMVILGDGYTATDIANGTYAAHVGSYLNYKFANSLNSEPFYRYRNFFNVHAIEVVSNESGADIPPDNVFVDTALDAKYYFDGTTERLLYINTTKANIARNAGLSNSSFAAEVQDVTINSTKYGGGGGSYAAFAGGNFFASELALHEVAHSFNNLADEYVGSPGPYTGSEPFEVNVTKDATEVKWDRWLGYNQAGIGTIGVYEGARYFNSGLYRPSINSKMRNLNQPFDAVSREKIILDIYDLVDPFDTWTNNDAPLTDPGHLSVTPIDEDVISIEWIVDDVLVPDANENSFNLADFGFGIGEYLVTARGFDPMGFDPIEGWVRTSQDSLEQLVFWNISVTVPEPSSFVLLLGLFAFSMVARYRTV